MAFHYRTLPLLYARDSDEVIEAMEQAVTSNKIKKVMKRSEVFRNLVYQIKSVIIRDMFDRENLPRKERAIRQQIKKQNLWLR